MAIEATLRTFLKTLGTVTAIVGAGNAARIRPDRLGESDTLPAIIIEVDGEDPENSLDGRGGLVYANVNIQCRAFEKEDARALAEAVRINGTDPGTGMAGTHQTGFDAVLESTSAALFIPEDAASMKGYFNIDCLYVVSFTEVV
jgi:hypothetical protein